MACALVAVDVRRLSGKDCEALVFLDAKDEALEDEESEAAV